MQNPENRINTKVLRFRVLPPQPQNETTQFGWFSFCAVSYAHDCDRRVPGAQLPSAPGGRYSAGCCGAAVKIYRRSKP